MKRITLDLDYKNEFRLSQVLTRILIKVEKIKTINIKPSSKKGYHIIIWTTKNYTLKEIFLLREILGDDRTRIKLDKLRKIGRNTLFKRKISLSPSDKSQKL